MPRLRPLLAGMALVLLACLGTGAAGAATAPPGWTEEPAMAAGAFVDSVGVNAAPGDAAAGWALAGRLEVGTDPDQPVLPGGGRVGEPPSRRARDGHGASLSGQVTAAPGPARRDVQVGALA